MYCYQCGKQVGEDVKFCPYCGAQLNSHDQNNGNGYNPINQNYQGSYQKPDDESSFGYALLSFFIPVVGLVLYLVWSKEYPLRAKSCIKGFIANIVFYVLMFCCIMSGIVGIASQYDDEVLWNHNDFNAVVETVSYE